jgi:hypothetical protein
MWRQAVRQDKLLKSYHHRIRANERFYPRFRKSDFAHPSLTVFARIVEPAGSFDQHVQAHHETESVFAAIIIDDVVINDDCAAGRKSIKCLAEKHLFLSKIPIMEDVTHDDDIHLRQRILEEISALKTHSVSHPAVSDKFLEDGLDCGKVETDADDVGMGAGESGGYHALS